MSDSMDINDLFKNASADGNLSQASMAALNVVDIGEQILAAMGVNVADVPASEVILVTLLVDDSGSIRFANNAQIIRDGHNSVLDALSKTMNQDCILVHTRYLNGHVLYPYCPVAKATKMNSKNYNPVQGTPLYDQTVVVLGTVLAKAQSFADNGIPCRTITLILTDGADVHSVKHNEKNVSSLVRDMARAESHIIAAMGVKDGDGTDFSSIFRSMGIEDRWILTPGNNDRDIRRAFQLFSRSVNAVSQQSGSFGQISLGGFGA